jgi:NAD(P)-dependent dehydrogenase (short-subunit alcohol dehydrogenase family)
MPSLVVLGARHLGGAIIDRFAARGYEIAAVSLGRSTAERILERHPEALALTADVSNPSQIEDVRDKVLGRFGNIDVAVNAVSPVRSGVVTGGPITELSADAVAPYTNGLIPAVYNFIRVIGGAMSDRGRGTLIQVTGGSARRAMPARGPWAAAAFATRALTHSAAQELRSQGVHAALLIVDAIIESDKTEHLLKDKPDEASASHDDVVDAVEYLVSQSPRGWTHELTLTPIGDRWLP